MSHQFSTLTFTEDVQNVQREMGSRTANEMLNKRGPENSVLGAFEQQFIKNRDGFYIATVGTTGWPYIQFRGGPVGFLRIIDERTLAYADVVGNRQYITTGNLRGNGNAAVFLMDYASQSRLKLLALATVTRWDESPDWKEELSIPERGRPERVVVLHTLAFDWNCHQHIPQRWSLEELKQSGLLDRVGLLEDENRNLRAALSEAHAAR